MPTPGTLSDVEIDAQATSTDYNSWAQAHTATVNAQTALATAQAAEAPLVAKVVADAQATITAAASYSASLLRAMGQDPVALLTGTFTAAVGP